jgi:hypothetical protein
MLTGPADASPALTLDVVKARIFYLASDVEPVHAPAAMLLRAVADAIEDGGGVARISEHAIANGHASPALTQATNVSDFRVRAPESVQSSGPRLGVASSQSGNKR